VGKLPPILSILVTVSIVLVVAAVLWWPQRAVAILVQPDRTTYGSGESVNFTLILKVGGNRAVTVSSLPGLACGNVDFVVEDESERPIYPVVLKDGLCPAMLAKLQQPGEMASWNLTWSQVNGSGSPVPAGHRYGILGVFSERGGQVRVFAALAWIFVGPTESKAQNFLST